MSISTDLKYLLLAIAAHILAWVLWWILITDSPEGGYVGLFFIGLTAVLVGMSAYNLAIR